jgi:superfamily II DNA or RNA helicase
LLAELLGEQDIEVVELHGSIAAKKRKERIEYIQSNEGKRFVILATGKYVGEGFDLPYLDTLFITLPIAWRGILEQYAGRIQREWAGKKLIRVFDYVDELPMLKRMWAKREKGYKALGYSLT